MSNKDEELGLSLSIGIAQASPPPFRMNLMSLASPAVMQNQQQENAWMEFLQSSGSDRNSDSRSFLRGIDVNQALSTAEGEEEAGVSSPNNTISSLSGKRSERDASCSRRRRKRGGDSFLFPPER